MQRILAPVDFSDLSANALRYAGGLAQCLNARLTVVYADPFLPPPYFTRARLAEVERQFRDAQQEAAASLRQFVEAAIPEVAAEVHTRVVEALPIDGIRAAAQALPADLVVMGTHGRGGINRLMLGSVTERVIRESTAPVLAVRGDRPATVKDFALRRILAAVNDSEPARRALERALDLAACSGAALTVLHVHEPKAEGKIEDLCGWIQQRERPGCSIHELVRKGDASEQVIALAAEQGSDLVVVGAQHRKFFDSRVIGTNTIRILRHAPCPVLAAP